LGSRSGGKTEGMLRRFAWIVFFWLARRAWVLLQRRRAARANP
jgi:hypothetical protein